LATNDGKLGALLVGALTLFAICAPLFLPDANASDWDAARAAGSSPVAPSASHWLGTDLLARDELARLAGGARVSLTIGGAAALVATTIGVAVGVSAATLSRSKRGRFGDALLMRVVDVLLAMPFLLTVTTLGVLVGRTSTGSMVLVLGLVGWTGLARVVRARALEVMSQDYMTAARALGASPWSLARRHVLPNVLPTAAVLATGLVGGMILAEAVLGYLSVGIEPPTASWGRMLHEAETLVTLAPRLVAAPAAGIVIAMLGFHRLGEGLVAATGQREALGPRRKWPLDLVIASLLLAVFVAMPEQPLSAPAAQPSAIATPMRGGTLHLATFYSVRALDPAVATDELSLAIGRMVFGRLVEFGDDGKPKPALAVASTWSADRKTLELELRRGVRFQDGSPFGASDVKRSIERALSPDAGSPGASHFEGIVGVLDYREKKADHIAGVRVLADDRVAFDLTEPDATLLARLSLSFVSPVCPTVTKLPKDTPDTELCGAGPFVIDHFEPETSVRLRRNDTYYEPGLPYLDAIEMEFHVRPQTQRYRFERGELDVVRELAASDAALMQNDPRWAPYMTFVKSQRVSAIFMNTTRPPFDRRDVRRAVSFAIDPEVMTLVRPDLEPLSRIVPSSIPGQGPALAERRHDLGAALQAMRDAGYPYDPASGQGGYPEPIDYVTVPDSFEQQSAEVYVEQLAKIGLHVRLRLLSFQSYLAEVQTPGRAQMGWAGWQADYPDPTTFFEPNLVSSAIGDVTQNYSLYANTDLDALIDRSKKEIDPLKRGDLFAEAERLVIEDAPWVPTYSPRVLELRQPWVGGYAPTPLESLDFERTYLVPSDAVPTVARAGGRAAVFSLARLSR